MRRRTTLTAATVVATFLSASLSVQPGPAIGADDTQPKIMPTPAELGKSASAFKAVISSSTLKVGQSALVTFTGSQLDVAGGNTSGSFGEEFASVVELTRVDKMKFNVKGLAPGNAVLTFRNGDREAKVKVTVVVR